MAMSKQSQTLEEIDWVALLKIREEYQAQRWKNVRQLQKCFYIEHEDVQKRTITDTEDFCKAEDVCFVENRSCVKPVKKVEEAFHNQPSLLRRLKRIGVDIPTSIQAFAWPILLSGMDIFISSMKRRGLVLAYLLPAIIHAAEQSQGDEKESRPNILIVTARKEVALQIQREVEVFSHRKIRSACFYAGRKQPAVRVSNISKMSIIVSTLERIGEIFACCDFNDLTYVVFDELDALLTQSCSGFLTLIQENTRPDKQLVITATSWTGNLNCWAATHAKQPDVIIFGPIDPSVRENVVQTFDFPRENEKKKVLDSFLDSLDEESKTICYMPDSWKCSEFAVNRALLGDRVCTVHEMLDAEEWEKELAYFREPGKKLLFATDIASQAIDANDVTHVLNFDIPPNIFKYMHRAERVGRNKKVGFVKTFITHCEHAQASALIKLLIRSHQHIPPELIDVASCKPLHRFDRQDQ